MFYIPSRQETKISPEKNSDPRSECKDSGAPNKLKIVVKQLITVFDERSVVGNANGKRLNSSITTRIFEYPSEVVILFVIKSIDNLCQGYKDEMVSAILV